MGVRHALHVQCHTRQEQGKTCIGFERSFSCTYKINTSSHYTVLSNKQIFWTDAVYRENRGGYRFASGGHPVTQNNVKWLQNTVFILRKVVHNITLQGVPLAYEDGKNCVAYDSANQLFLAMDCSEELDVLCFIRKRLGEINEELSLAQDVLEHLLISQGFHERGMQLSRFSVGWKQGSWGLL